MMFFKSKQPEQKSAESEQKAATTALDRLLATVAGTGVAVTPETCTQSPTVQAVVTAISRRMAITPIHIFQTKENNGRATKEKIPSHPVAKLLKQPNEWQTGVDYIGDMASVLVRYGRFIAIKGQGNTGPIRKLYPVRPSEVAIKQDDISAPPMFERNGQSWPMSKIHYVRGPAQDFITGDSPVEKIKTAIGVEIAVEEYGASFFNNGAVPLQVFGYAEGMGFKTPDEEKTFLQDFKALFSGAKRHNALMLPKGIEQKPGQSVENNKAQFLETRKLYQTIIAGAWGVPPHLVGNLENGHYNNVEQQDKDFTLNVIMPYVRYVESAMERDLLTTEDRNKGIVIRFNMDSVLRASFEERQAGLAVQRMNGIINANDWLEIEGRNPRPEGDDYYYSANLIKEGEELDRGRPDPQNIKDPEGDPDDE